MRKLRTIALLALMTLAAYAPLSAGDYPQQESKVQIAILLDTSGSMDGLIEQAKTRLWDLVNEMASAHRGGQTPTLEVALYEYGKSSISAERGHLARLVPLTTDLDKVSEALFALRTNGGEEYCGRVIREAQTELAWSPSNDDFKAIFIAGNEAFDQGDVPFRKWCSAAIAKGIVVNTIFCGNEAEGINTHWKEGADLADGRFMVIDHNQSLVEVAAPQDADILALGQSLNETYVGYGSSGLASKARQQTQDRNAEAASPAAAVKRTIAKSGKAYKAEKWDLVSAVDEGADVTEMEEDALPEPMQKMTDEEKRAFVAEKKEKRKSIQEKINTLKKERQDWLEKNKSPEQQTLDKAMKDTIREQMKKKQFKFEK